MVISLTRGPHRIDGIGLVDRGRPLEFSFNGRTLGGCAGDSVASALLANGVRLVGRSYKYHRPRGVFSAGEEEPCALVETGEGGRRTPNCRAPMVPLTQGLAVRSQLGWPSTGWDLGRIVDATHRLWPAGFYNKTFKWPAWKTWEPAVRSMAGLGHAPIEEDPDRYEQVNVHCDLLIHGAGPAGLTAALVAARSGLRVIIAEQDTLCGGVLNSERIELDGEPASHWVRRVVAEIDAMPNVMVLTRTTAVATYDANVTTLVQITDDAEVRECLWTVRPRQVLLAAGAIEQGLIFPDNDRPGIMLAGAVRTYLNRYGVACGARTVVAANNDTAWQTAFDLSDTGLEVAAVVDVRSEVDSELQAHARQRGIDVFSGCLIGGTRGARGIRNACIEGPDGRVRARLDCDLLAVSGGWAPRVHAVCQARGGLRFDEYSQSFIPDRLPAAFHVVGAARGTAGLRDVLEEAGRVASRIVAQTGRKPEVIAPPEVTRSVVESRSTARMRVQRRRRRQWIDLVHDVTFDDAELAVREGFDSVELFKRFTTTGMGADQGKTGNLNAFIVLGELTGRSPGEVGVTTFRPMYTPVSLGALAGRTVGEFHAPRRYLPAHRVHLELGGVMEDYDWQRPDAYPRNNEDLEQAAHREVLAVRRGVGVFDNSPIGKIEVRGPDATEFLERVYINRVSTLPPGRARYGLMLDDRGVIMDDGVFVRIAKTHFVIHSTSAGASRVTRHLEEWLQCEWPDLEVVIDDMTAQWACFTIAGPDARKLIEAMKPDFDASPGALPHMAFVSGRLADTPVRVARVSFSGESSFEVSVPAHQGEDFLRTLLDAGDAWGLTPYGIEALMILRLEKGFMHVGTDTDGSSVPHDVGWGRVARAKPSDFIGRRSLALPANTTGRRRQLVGLEAVNPHRAMRPGDRLQSAGGARTEGWVTSASYSPTLDRHIALAMLEAGRERLNERLELTDEDECFEVRVVSPVFHDPGNERLHA